MLEQELRQRIVGGELLQYLLIGRRLPGGGLLDHREFHALEQDFAELTRRSKIERTRRQLERLLLEREDSLA